MDLDTLSARSFVTYQEVYIFRVSSSALLSNVCAIIWSSEYAQMKEDDGPEFGRQRHHFDTSGRGW